ncbi:MAG TPA: sigma 54-interacting transcriptional regulator, partial [Candidatus Edwardsbacteria bacterium]|nr:sigma 54-interacting transcriptional regulator [Candidatus Edwardsbacteria bacterium]
GLLIILVVLIQNILLTWLFFQAKGEARRQVEGRLFLVADQARLVWQEHPVSRPDSVVARWRRIGLSGGAVNTGVLGKDGSWLLATDTLQFARPEQALLGLDAAGYRRLEETGWASSALYQRQRQTLLRYYLGAGLKGEILVVEAPAEFLRALENVGMLELWSAVGLLALVLALFLWYLNIVLAPFRQMAAATRRNLGEGPAGGQTDVALVMDVYQRAIDELQQKGKSLQQLYDQTRTQAERSELLNRQILESVDKGIITLDNAGLVTWHNRTAARLLDARDQAGVQGWIAGEGMAAKARSQQPLTWERALSGGGRLIIQIESGRLRDADGSDLGWLLVLSDITARRLLEEQAGLYDQMRLLRQAAQKLHDRVAPLVGGLRGECAQPGVPGGSFLGHLDEIERAVQDFGRHLDYYPSAGQAPFDQAIIYRSEAMAKVMDLAAKVAPTDSTVLLTGESGTGKELLAREIHRLSRHSDGPFVSLNCGALPESLLESELFGYVKGAFTGALRDKPGLLQAAEGGSFLLDEVSDLSPALQVKLLRVVQEREAVPVGSTRPVKVNIRLIAASNQDLEQQVKLGKFRQDLFFRLNVFPVRIPPLRQRTDDIMPLAASLLQKHCAKAGKDIRHFSDQAQQLLLRHEWPGNVRELENLIERAVLLAQGPVIEAEHIDLTPREHSGEQHQGLGLLAVAARAAAEAESKLIKETLAAVNGNKSEASRRLKISYRVMLKKIKDYNLE